MDSYLLRDETNLKVHISQDNSIYTHYLLTVIEKIKDKLEEALEFYRKSSMEEFIEKKEKIKMIFPLKNLDRNVENLQKNGLLFKKKNLEDLELKVIGKIHI